MYHCVFSVGRLRLTYFSLKLRLDVRLSSFLTLLLHIECYIFLILIL